MQVLYLLLVEFFICNIAHLVSDVPHNRPRSDLRLLPGKELLLCFLDTLILLKVLNHSLGLAALLKFELKYFLLLRLVLLTNEFVLL